MKKRNVLMAVLAPAIVGASLVVSGLAAAAAEPIKIGMVGPITGPAANVGVTVRATWELLVKEINAAGGLEIDGVKRPVELVVADSQSKPSNGVSAAQRLLTRDQVDVLAGDILHSDVTLALMELAPSFPNKVFYAPLPVSSSIADRVEKEPAKYGNVWKWHGDAPGYGKSMAEYLTLMTEQGQRKYPNKTYAFVVEGTDYSAAIMKAAQSELGKLGWKQVGSEVVPIAHTDFSAPISKLKAAKPDIVISIFTAASSGLAYIKQSKEQAVDYENIATYYPANTAFIDGIGSAGNGLVYFAASTDYKRSERGRAFGELLKANNIPLSSDAALGYCSGKVLLSALARAKSAKADRLNAELLKTDDDTCPNYERIVFDPKRHTPLLGEDHFFFPAMQIFEDGKSFITVYPEKAATGKLDEFSKK